jgi:hypothetical protein
MGIGFVTLTLNPWVEIYNRAEFGAGIGFAAFE